MSHRILTLLSLLLVLGACASWPPELNALSADHAALDAQKPIDDARLDGFVAECNSVAAKLEDHDHKFEALFEALDVCARGGTYAHARAVRADVMRQLLPVALEDTQRQTLVLILFAWVGRQTADDLALEGAEYRGYTDALAAATTSNAMKAASLFSKLQYLHQRGEAAVPMRADDRALALALLTQLEARKGDLDGYWGKGIDDRIAAWRSSFTANLVGAEAAEIEGADLDGVAFKLSDYRGNVVMLDFWGYW